MTEENSENALAGWLEVAVSDLTGTSEQPLATFLDAPLLRCFRHNDGFAAVVARIAEIEGLESGPALTLAGENDPRAGVLSVSAGAGPDRIAGAVDRCTGDEKLGPRPLYLALTGAEEQSMTSALRMRLVAPTPVGTLDVHATDVESRWNLYRVKLDERLSPDLRRELLTRGVGPGPIEGPDNLRGREKWFQRRSGGNE